MNTNINKIVNDISKANILERIVYEAILNSIHAESTNIECIFEYINGTVQSEFKNIKSINIIDNGVGFTDDNIKSFDTYLSEFKTKKWGSKGTGRFSFLKLFKNVYYESSFQKDSQIIRKKLNFSIKDGLLVSDIDDIQVDTTKLVLEEPVEFQDINIEKLIENTFIKIYPMLAFIKNDDSGRKLNISFKVKDMDMELKSYSLLDIVNLESNVFDINYKDSDGKQVKEEFKLYYYVSDENEHQVQSNGYCAGNIHVKKFDIAIKLKNKSYLFFLYSKYFDSQVNDSRTDFPNIKNIDTTLIAPINWNMINLKLKESLDHILFTKYPDMMEKSNKLLEAVKSNFPYLEELIDDSYTSSVGYITQGDLLNSGYKKIDSIKDNIRKITEKFVDTHTISDDDYDSLIKNASLDLAEYVTNRQVILDRMKIMIANNESVENNIHNLIMPMRTIQNKDCIDLKTTNLWLVDDKFMSFTNALSDKNIKTAFKEITNTEIDSFDGARKEPDIVMYFNNNIQKDKLVIIELKSFSTHSLKKKNGVDQLLDYIEIIKKNVPNIKEQWYYLITTIDDEFRKRLTRDSFKQILSSNGGYFRYYEDESIESNVYVLDMQELITDANLRNKAFMDVFKGGFAN